MKSLSEVTLISEDLRFVKDMLDNCNNMKDMFDLVYIIFKDRDIKVNKENIFDTFDGNLNEHYDYVELKRLSDFFEDYNKRFRH